MAELEKVIEHLKEIAEYFRECRSNVSFACKAENHFWELQNAASEAADALTLLKAQEPGWISVKDRLPVKNANVLWWCEIRDRHMGHVRIGFFEGVTNHDIPEVSCCAPNCIPMYWMPLPEPPKEETK